MNENAVSTDAVVGIDVAKLKVDLYAVLHGKGKSKVFDNTASGHRELQRWLSERGFVPATTHVCMEATGSYPESLATALVAGGWTVSVVNPALSHPRRHSASYAVGWIVCRRSRTCVNKS